MKLLMKKSILFLLCSIIISRNLKAQTVFAPLNSKWNYVSTKDFGDETSLYKKYETLKDTIYHGQLCSKIVGRSIKVSASGSIVDTTQEKALYTYTRNDTVFYYNENFNRFYPLYVFNVKVGDTIIYHVPYMVLGKTDTTFSVVIDSIKNLSLDGVTTRVIYSLKTPSSLFGLGPLYERLGTIGGGGYNYPIIGYIEHFGLPYRSGLTCYSDALIDTNLQYLKLDCDLLNPSSINYAELKDQIAVSPNPFKDKIQVEIPKQLQKTLHYSLYDILGKKIDILPNVVNSSVVFDLSNFKQGVYVLLISTTDGRFSKTLTLIKNN